MFKNLFNSEEIKPLKEEVTHHLEIETVVFDPDNPVIIAGAQTQNINQGYKGGTIKMLGDGVFIEIPGHKSVYVHRSKTRQIFFK